MILMFDFPLWFLLLCLPLGLVIYASDEHRKRKKEEARRQKELEIVRKMEAIRLRQMQEQAELEERCGLTKK